MARTKKQKIELNSNDSLQGVMQEAYNNACTQIQDAQKIINEVTASSSADDVEDITKVAKTKIDALRWKDSAIKIKLDIGKLQNDIIKHNGAIVDTGNVIASGQLANVDNFSKIRDMIKENSDKVNKSS